MSDSKQLEGAKSGSSDEMHASAKSSPITRFTGFLGKVILSFDRDACFILASSIVYTTLISVIPFVTFILSMLTAFGAFNQAQEYLSVFFVEQFGPVAGPRFLATMTGFVQNANGMGVVGLISFLITSVILINRVWVTFNQIYKTSMNRNPMKRFAEFITVLIVGTILLGAYLSINSLLSDWFVTLAGGTIFNGAFYKVFEILAPWLVLWISFFLLIYAVPSTKVKAASALLGSIAGTILFRGIAYFFSMFIVKVVNYSIIYGSLASLLLGMVWVYMIWVVILLAVEIAYVHQYNPDRSNAKGLPEMPVQLISEGINVLAVIADYYDKGLGAVNTKDIARQLRIPDRRLYLYLDLLVGYGFILKMDRAGTHFIPAKPAEDMHIETIVDIIYGGLSVEAGDAESPGKTIALDLYEKGRNAIKAITIKDVIARSATWQN